MTRTSRVERGFTLVELLVVIAIIAVIAGLVVPALMSSQSKAYMLECRTNLRGLATAAMAYSQKKREFPFKKDAPAHESLMQLVHSSSGADLEPKHFVCPEGNGKAAIAEKDENDRTVFIIDEDSLDYTWIASTVKAANKKPLSCDKYPKDFLVDGDKVNGHKDAILIVDTAASVQEIDVRDAEDQAKWSLDTDEMLPKGLIR